MVIIAKFFEISRLVIMACMAHKFYRPTKRQNKKTMKQQRTKCWHMSMGQFSRCIGTFLFETSAPGSSGYYLYGLTFHYLYVLSQNLEARFHWKSHPLCTGTCMGSWRVVPGSSMPSWINSDSPWLSPRDVDSTSGRWPKVRPCENMPSFFIPFSNPNQNGSVLIGKQEHFKKCFQERLFKRDTNQAQANMSWHGGNQQIYAETGQKRLKDVDIFAIFYPRLPTNGYYTNKSF